MVRFKVFCNEVLAHHYRDKSVKSLFDYPTLKQYKVPTKLKDKILVPVMIGNVTALLANAYPDFFGFFLAKNTSAKR